MSAKKKEAAPFGVGISSLLMVFVVLCLTVFGVLAYMTARAEEALARLDEALSAMPGEEALEAAGFSVSEEEGALTGDLEIPVDGTRVYRLRVRIENGEYAVTARQTEDNTVWEEEHLDVWDGQ